MLKKLTQASLLIFSIAFTSFAQAEGSGYQTLSPAQPTQHTNKVEVIEFFWYGCPHCYDLEPLLQKWVKNLPANVEFIRQPAVFSELWGKHARAYFTAESLGVVEKIHTDFFNQVQAALQSHDASGKMDTEAEQQKFFVEHGVTEAAFKEAYSSFAVDSKMRQAPAIAARYGITGVPALIINGKYVTNGPLAGSHEKMLEIADQLIKQESEKK
ncbi:thiol:disulfide interchange protein DsbA/DsbL [Methylosoma difficile]